MISACGDYGLASILSVAQKVISLIQMIAPILLLVMASIQLIRLVVNPELKGGVKSIYNKFIAAAIIFFIPVIVDVAMGVLDSSFQLSSCYQVAKTINSISSVRYVDVDDTERKKILTDEIYEKGTPNPSNHSSGSYSKDVESFMKAVQNTVLYAKNNGYHYGDSQAIPPTSDGLISCDRLISKALWDLGYTDQKNGGEDVVGLTSYLPSHGFIKSTNIRDCKYGSIVVVSHNGVNGPPHHAFVVYSYNPTTGAMKTFDEGAEWRITANQPFDANWTQESIYGIYNMK